MNFKFNRINKFRNISKEYFTQLREQARVKNEKQN
jgi:hypothetical protein